MPIEEQPFHVTLTKNTKGYQWEISIHGDNAEKTVDEIIKIDNKLSIEYGKANQADDKPA